MCARPINAAFSVETIPAFVTERETGVHSATDTIASRQGIIRHAVDRAASIRIVTVHPTIASRVPAAHASLVIELAAAVLASVVAVL